VAKARRAASIAVVLSALALAGPARAQSLPGDAVRQAMAIVETQLAKHDIDVKGYAATSPPLVERVSPSHDYLRGNDGGYADGRIYLNEELNEDCVQLTLVHELVHDVTIKHRLFADVPNSRIRQVLEALADVVTAAAAEDPYLPGCLPKRQFLVSAADLASLAGPALRR
jgi:hypothetical protein